LPIFANFLFTRLIIVTLSAVLPTNVGRWY